MEKSLIEGAGRRRRPLRAPVGCAPAAGVRLRRLSGRWRLRRRSAAGHLGLALGRGQIGARGSKGMGAVARDQQALVGNVESAGIEGDVEFLLEIAAGVVFGGISSEVGRDVLPLAGRHIDLDQAAAASARAIANAIDDVWIFGIGLTMPNSEEGSGLQSVKLTWPQLPRLLIMTAPVSCCAPMMW